MATKVLYLGNGKWCYTNNCKQHASLIKAQKDLKNALVNNDTKGISEATNVMLTSKEGQAAFYHTKTQHLKESLGRNPILGLDLDGTTGDFTAGLRWHMATKDHTMVLPREEWLTKFPDPDSYDYHEGNQPWFTSREDFVTNFQDAEKRGVYKQIPVYPNASETLNELKNYGFDIKVVTARNALFNEDTSAWLKESLIPYEGIRNPGHAKETELADVYMDDAPVVINRLLAENKKVLGRTQRYNENNIEETSNFRRVKDWEDNVVGALFELLDDSKNKKRNKS